MHLITDLLNSVAIYSHCYYLFLSLQCRLFELDPHLVELFPFGAEGATEDNESLRKHAFGVMSTIDAALEMVQKKEIEELVTTLQELGTVHSLNNIEPVHFGVSQRYNT